MMSTRLLVAAQDADEPLTLEELKESLRIDHTDDDEMLRRHLIAARDWVERRVQTKFALQTWEFTTTRFPCGILALPFGPIQEIVSLLYDDASGDELSLTEDTNFRQSATALVPISQWPSSVGDGESVRVQFVAGYDEEIVPESIRVAIILKVQELYDGEDTAAAVDRLLQNHLQMVA